MQSLAQRVGSCTECKLCGTRRQAVPGEGEIPARVMFVGGAPSPQDDATGVPFSGRDGQLLRNMIKFLGFENYYLTDIVKCCPPENEIPDSADVYECRQHLLAEIAEVRPRIIVAVGALAAQYLLATSESLANLRKNVYRFHGNYDPGIIVMPVYSPAYVLKKPEQMGCLLSDLRNVRVLEESLR